MISVVVTLYKKPIATLRDGLPSVDLDRLEPHVSQYERSDVTALPAAGVIGESMLAIGREQLRRLPEIVRARRALADQYRTLLSAVPGLGLPVESPWARSNWQSFCVRLPDACDQRRVMQRMLDLGVATRRGIMCSHREPAYAGYASRAGLAASEAAQDRCIVLPLYPQMTEAEQTRVAEALASACAGP